jgi:hypothetical protein
MGSQGNGWLARLSLICLYKPFRLAFVWTGGLTWKEVSCVVSFRRCLEGLMLKFT